MNISRLLENDIYLCYFNNEDFLLSTASLSDSDISMKRVTVPDIFKYVSRNEKSSVPDPLFDFLVSYAVLSESSSHYRKRIALKTGNKTRNINLKTHTTRNFLKGFFKFMDDKKPSIKSLNAFLMKALEEVRIKLNFPHPDPVEYSYKITEEVVLSASSQACKDYLETRHTLPFIFLKDFKNIKATLNSKYPDDAKNVISAINDTKSRDHLSAVSLESFEDQLFVHIVNPGGQQIRLEDWKLLFMLEDAGKPRLLYDFRERFYKGQNQHLFFNNCTNGQIIGAYYPDNSYFLIINSNEKEGKKGNNQTTSQEKIHDKASFIMDSSYLLCLYITLKRLKEDKTRFSTLKERADSAEIDSTLFDSVFKPFD